MIAIQTSHYPVTYTQNQPEALSRWLWIFKGLLLIPHLFLLAFLGMAASIVVFISWIAILVTGRHPRGLWEFLVGVNRWSATTSAYVLHTTDSYPPFSLNEVSSYPVDITAIYPESSNRLTTFFRWLLAIPQLIVLYFLGMVLSAVWLIHIVIVVFTGKPNPEIFSFIVGVLRWQIRVNLYTQLITDVYPPFSLE